MAGINNEVAPGSVDLSGVVQWAKLTSVLPVEIPEWARPVLWEISTSNFSSTSNPSPAQCLLNSVYTQYLHFPSNYFNAWIAIDFKADFVVKKVGLTPFFQTAYDSDSLDFQSSTDGQNWITIATNVPTATEIDLSSKSVKRRYFRIVNRDSNISNGWIVNQLKFFGNY